MKKKSLYNPNVGDQESEDMEGEENRTNTRTIGLLYSEADKCPICLNCLLGKEVGFPESCNHVFCITCILKWAETLASCPIDRKPFQAVFKFSALEGCVKIQVKRQVREIKDKKNESPFKKQFPSHENSKSYMRKRNTMREDLLCERFYDLMLYRNFSNNKMRAKKNGAIKIDKPRRSDQCTNPCLRNFFSNMFSSSHSEESFTYRAYCTEFIEISEISAMVRQKRRELELSWFPDTLPGIGRIGFIPWNVETEVLPLISFVLPRTIFPSTMSLENFGTSHKEYALAHTQGGEEKKQTSGTSNTRGSRRKTATTTPTRRSTRNTRAETVSQSQKSPVSNNSGSDAPGNNTPSVSISSPSESEKQTRQAPKRKSVRRGRKAPLLKKKLRRSVTIPEKTMPSDSVEEEAADYDTPPLLEKEQSSDIESSDICSVHTDVENRLVNCLKSCSEQTKENEESTKNHDSEKEVEFSCSESCTQDPPVLVGEEKNQALEDTSVEAQVLCVESEGPKESFKKESDPLESSDHIPGSSESEVKAFACADCPPDDLLTRLASDVEGYQPVCSSLLGEVSEDAESVVNEERTVQSLQVGSADFNESAAEIGVLIQSPKLEFAKDKIVHTLDKNSIEGSEIQLPKHVETETAEVTPACDASESESFSNQECENNSLKNNFDNTQLDTSVEEKTESLIDHSIPVELPTTEIEQSEKCFSEDNNETIPMECDSFCSDQNESEVESSVNADSKQLNENYQMNENYVAHASENKPSSDPTNEKVETVSQPTESPIGTVDKGKKPRTRRSRFHSPSTTWSPNKDTAEEKKRSQSPSPQRETGIESKKSLSPSPKKESARGRRKSRSPSPRKDVVRERRCSQSRSPKRESSREAKRSESGSPRRDPSRENQRSQSRVNDSSSREKSRSRSREREGDRDGQRRDWRARRWSRSRSRSRSPSRSRTKSKSSSFSRNERDRYSPRWKERWTNDGWRCPRGNDRYRRNDSEKQNENMRKEKSDSADTNDPNSADKHGNDCPTWVTEKINSGPDPRTRNPEKLKESHWEENRNENSGNWNKSFGSGWMSNRGRGNRGKGTYRGSFAYNDQSENRWQNRKPLSGNSNSSGNDSLKFVEQQPYKRKSEQEFTFDTPADRSGWTSASSWAVRKTLPADVQNYYSRRGRNASGPQCAWMRQEETAEQDSNLKDQTNQVDGSQLPVNMMQPQMNIIQQQMNAQPQPMNIYPYPVGVHAPLMNMQRSPFPMHPQLPLHLHPGMPLMQVAPPTVTQGLPPPPPPPPPSQQVSYIASQPDGKQLQGIPSASHVSNSLSTPVLPTPTAAPGNAGTVQGPSSGNTSSSSHIQASNAAVKLAESKVSVTVEASADSSKTDKKLQIQEKAAQEVKLAIKPFYQNKDITKEEYKEIVRKAVDKVCHSKSGEVNSTKVANLVKAYVDKYKYSRKGTQKKTLEEPVPTEKNIG